VFKAADGEEALKLFQDVKIDIAILDIRMPHKDGLAVLKEMRDISDDFEAIILTGFGNEDSAIKAMRSGAINFIRKPIDIDHLLVSVEKAIEKLRLTRALKYRDRELEIQKEFFAYINKNKEIVVNIGTHFNKQIEIFAKQLLDSIPMAIFVVNKEFTILTYNRDLRKILDGKDQTLNEDFVSKLAKAGGHNIAYDELISRINKVFEQPSGTFERMEIGKYGYIHMSLIKVVKTFKGEKSDVVVVAIRGERS
jgi:response regulator RpfG family c-di-GMP phosphodiesterase